MKKTSALLAGLFFTFVFVSSCGTKYPKEIAQVDTLQILLNEADSELKVVDTLKVGNVARDLKANLVFIQKNYTDTFSREMAEFLIGYSSVQKSMESIKEEYNKLSKEINYSKEQLKDIRHDLEHNILKEDQVKEYCEREEEAVKRNLESVKAMTGILKEKMELADKNNSSLKQMVEQLKSKLNKN